MGGPNNVGNFRFYYLCGTFKSPQGKQNLTYTNIHKETHYDPKGYKYKQPDGEIQTNYDPAGYVRLAKQQHATTHRLHTNNDMDCDLSDYTNINIRSSRSSDNGPHSLIIVWIISYLYTQGNFLQKMSS